jgi:hypothetical protein
VVSRRFDFELRRYVEDGKDAYTKKQRRAYQRLARAQEKLSFGSKEVIVEYVPQTKESKLIRIPIVKRFEGVDLAVVSLSDKNSYLEIEDSMKKESVSKRDEG